MRSPLEVPQVREDSGWRIFVACYEFTDVGVELLIAHDVPFMETSELFAIGVYYSVIFSKVNSDKGALFGPLPVPQHYDSLVVIYGSAIRDENIRDPRIVKAEYLTPFFVYIFFPIEFDKVVSSSRVLISTTIDEWFHDKSNVDDITLESLDGLRSQLTEVINKEQTRIDHLEAVSPFRTALAKNISFLDTIGQSLDRPIRIGIFGSIDDVIFALQDAVGRNIRSLRGIHASSDGSFVAYCFSHLYLEGEILESDKPIDFKRTANLTNVAVWKDRPKEFDGVLLTLQIPKDEEEMIQENFQRILRRTPDYCPISLFIRYESHYPGDISHTPIPKLLSEAKNRTISLLEDKSDHKTIETALNDIIEKIVPFLRAKRRI